MPLLGQGALLTLELSVAAWAGGTLLGIIAGLLRASAFWVLRIPAQLYIEVFRSVPILIQLYFMFFALPVITGINLSAYMAGVIALSFYCGAFMAEVVRTGVTSVTKAQRDAAYSLGMRSPSVMRYVVAPQALRVAIPPAINLYVMTIKDSSLASIIGLLEMMGVVIGIRNSDPTGDTNYALLAAAVFYFVVCFTLSTIGQRLRLRLQV
jgi:polar amino acid transport system permease protein